MSNVAFTFDAKDFALSLDHIFRHRMKPALIRGVGKAAIQWLNDATMQVPTTPVDTGRLRSSGTAFVQGKRIKISPNVMRRGYDKQGIQGPTPANTDNELILPGNIIGTILFSTEYAMKVHEGIHIQFREPGAGAKYLERPGVENGHTYVKIIVDEARKA